VNSKSRSSSTYNYSGWAALTAYLLFLIYRALSHRAGNDAADIPLWNLQNSHQFVYWIGGFFLRGFCEFAYAIPLGFITALVFPQNRTKPRWLPINITAFIAIIIFVLLLRTIETDQFWYLAGVVGLALPLLGFLFGTWIGTTWLHGGKARLWLLPKIALLVLMIVSCCGILLWLAVEDKSLPIEAAKVTSAEKRRLVHLIREKSPRSLIEGQTHTLCLTEHDINVLLSWGLSLGSPNRKAKVDINQDLASFAASIGVAHGRGNTYYLNAEIAGRTEIKDKNLTLNMEQFRLGSVKVPHWFLRIISPVVTSMLKHNRLSKPFFDATKAVAIQPDSIAVTYGPLHLPPNKFREDLFGPANSGQELLASTRVQAEHLLAVVSESPDKQPEFGECFETAFSLARVRSMDGKDPIIENRAAIFSLGILLGHPRVEEFLGPVHISYGNYTARRMLSRVAVRNRSDWTKHFCVAAAIALLSDEIVSDAASVLKEELDSDTGGSGFSFSDLIASRAGTTFALQATYDERAARAMQDRIVCGFRVDDFFPPAADLPEGITDTELQSHYGGVGGEGYNRMMEIIEQRIASCAAYQQL
jgi:hypothetical protein